MRQVVAVHSVLVGGRSTEAADAAPLPTQSGRVLEHRRRWQSVMMIAEACQSCRIIIELPRPVLMMLMLIRLPLTRRRHLERCHFLRVLVSGHVVEEREGGGHYCSRRPAAASAILPLLHAIAPIQATGPCNEGPAVAVVLALGHPIAFPRV